MKSRFSFNLLAAVVAGAALGQVINRNRLHKELLSLLAECEHHLEGLLKSGGHPHHRPHLTVVPTSYPTNAG